VTFWIHAIAFIIVTLTLLAYRHVSVRQLQEKLNHANEQLKIKSDLIARLSRIDSLTKLYNRVSLEELIEEERKRFERYGNVFCTLVLDIDRFKEVNDLFGHAKADKVLQSIATTLKDSIRFNDMVGRWGGEDFIIICPQTQLEGAVKLAETLRVRIEQSEFASVSSLTCSVGVAEVFKDETKEHLLARADEALYRAKALGRNRVCVAEQDDAS
jgi:diguanylate cyclase (GGDEF)-like protein